jgi:hypothetical protein
MARHALGLDGSRKSYRNRYFAPHNSEALKAWHDLAVKGLAETGGTRAPAGSPVFCCLTRRGAEAVLEPGETLCPEDFPQ